MKSVLSIVGALVLLTGAQAIAAPPVFDPGEKGPYEVGNLNLLLLDESRDADSEFGGRPIPVYIWYPVDPENITSSTPEAVYPLDPMYNIWPVTTSSEWEGYGIDGAFDGPPVSASGPFPLVMFSPGWGLPAWFDLFIGTRLASHGFVVAATSHFGDGWFLWEPWHHTAVAALNRPLDISYALTSILEKSGTAGDLLYGAVRPFEIAASGHSLGGYAAMTLAAGDDSVCDSFYGDPIFGDPPPSTCVPSLPDPRIKVIAPLDGSNQFLKFHELARVTTPAQGMGQEWDALALLGRESWQARQHAAFSGNPNNRVDLSRANHYTFTNLCGAVQLLGDKGLWPQWQVDLWLSYACESYISPAESQRLITMYMIAFLKHELSGDPAYQEILTPGWALTMEPDIEFFVTERMDPHAIHEDPPATFVYFMHQPGSEKAQATRDAEQVLPILRMPDWH